MDAAGADTDRTVVIFTVGAVVPVPVDDVVLCDDGLLLVLVGSAETPPTLERTMLSARSRKRLVLTA